MTFRARLTLAFTAATVIPLAVLALGVRREMTAQLDRQVARRVAAEEERLRADLQADLAATRARLHRFGTELAGDNRFRLAFRGHDAERRWLLDWAESVMEPNGLAVLQLRDSAGRILSSGHFRNEYDRVEPELPRGLAAADGGAAVVEFRMPAGIRLALATIDSFGVAGRRFTVLGGTSVDPVRFGDGEEIGVALVSGGSPEPDHVAARVPLPYLAAAGTTIDSAWFLLTRDPAVLEALRAGVDRWFAIALLVTFLLAMSLSIWLATRVSRPLAELAEKTGKLDLDRLDQEFATEREDEIGALSRLLDAMTRRLRAGASRLRDAERRAATGDLARQINHDVKNGLAPIRHVLRHWSQTAEREPGRLADVFLERRGTVESSVEYLENLARNYARLAPAPDLRPSDPNALLVEVARAAAGNGARVEARPGPGVPPVRADPVILRRILENLVANAIDAIEGVAGDVTLASDVVPAGSERRVRLTVTDTGRGMSRDELERAFDDFFTTKEGGTGLGLSVVRRLVADLGGTLRVETAPGRGCTFTVELPAA